MHPEAHAYVSRFATNKKLNILDIGGRDINGNCRDLFPNAMFTVIDKYAAPDVHIVTDFNEYPPTRQWDMILCTEVLEHCQQWVDLLDNAYFCCEPDGRIVITAATYGRAGHSGIDGGQLRHWEWYENIGPAHLTVSLQSIGWREVTTEVRGKDVYATAVK